MTSYEHICKIWTSEPDRFILDPIHQMPGLNRSISLIELTYPINFIGHDEWLHSEYEPSLSRGDVITRDGEVIGSWRVVGYDPNDEFSSGRFELIALGEDKVTFTEELASLDMRVSRGFALSTLTRTI